jgi:hypothetical protein
MTREKLALVCEAHRILINRIVEESNFEAVLLLIQSECAARAGMNNRTPTIKQKRYRDLAPSISAAVDAATMGRI